jgi:hypothetical protein
MRIELIMPMPQSHPVMLNGAKRSEASKVDSSPTFGMTGKDAWNDQKSAQNMGGGV